MIRVYTDGGCSGNPGPGGWAYVILEETFQGMRLIEENCGGEKDTTNNRMELTAVIKALEVLARPDSRTGRSAQVVTDSQYVQKGITEWIANWKRRAWRTADKTPVKNRDLWERLDSLAGELSLTWTWVKGHAGDRYNERCDALTQEAIARL